MCSNIVIGMVIVLGISYAIIIFKWMADGDGGILIIGTLILGYTIFILGLWEMLKDLIAFILKFFTINI